MATQPCKHCLHPVAKNAKRCPECGGRKPYPEEPAPAWLILVVGFAVFGCLAWGWLGNNEEDQDERSQKHTTSINETPYWYQGAEPWDDLTLAERANILRMRATIEDNQSHASEPSSILVDPDHAQAGQALIEKIIDLAGVDSYYKTPRTFGSRKVIWLPETVWRDLDDTQRQSIEAYMSSRYANWGIGVGRISGRDITADRLVVER